MENSVNYPKAYDIIYRSGYIAAFLGIFLFAASYPFFNYTIIFLGISFFYLGSLTSAIFLLVWKREIKIFILSCIIFGILLSALFLFFKNIEILIVSIGLVLAGVAGLYGKEAHCFHFYEGWVLMWSFPILILGNLIIYGGGFQTIAGVHIALSIIYYIMAVLALSFLIKKLRQPLMHFCENQ